MAGCERILFVDDEAIFAEMTKSLLESLGYSVTGFSSSIEALHTFSQHADEFDLVITDQSMPRMTGLELAANI